MMETRKGIAEIKFDEMRTINISSSTMFRQLINSEQESIRAIIMGPTCTVFSSLKLNEWKWIRNHHSDFLRITDERGNLSFSVGLSDDMPGQIEDDKVVFGSISCFHPDLWINPAFLFYFMYLIVWHQMTYQQR